MEEMDHAAAIARLIARDKVRREVPERVVLDGGILVVD